MEDKEIHIDVNQIRLLILERKDEIKENSKLRSLEFLVHMHVERKKREVILMSW